MPSDGFELEILTPEKADVYVAYAAGGPAPWPLVRRLDAARLSAVTEPEDFEPRGGRAPSIMSGCSGLVAVLPYLPSETSTTEPELVEAVRLAAGLGLPTAVFAEPGVRAASEESDAGACLRLGDGPPVVFGRGKVYGPLAYAGDLAEAASPAFERFLADALKAKTPTRHYAFFVGRLERDFDHAREAIRVAVGDEAGMPCLWSDDGRHRLGVESVRETTRLLIQHAAFVIADLTLGVESPERENPSRAHEIGLSIAYGRKLMLCSQEPRRYPYFSIGDMQMTFWSDEADLELKMREWIRQCRDLPARAVLNHRLPEAGDGYEPRIKRPAFNFDPKQRYVGPKTRVLPGDVAQPSAPAAAPAVALGGGALILALAHLATQSLRLGSGPYWAAYAAVVFTIFVWPSLGGRARGLLGTARPATQFLVLAALTLMTIALASTAAP